MKILDTIGVTTLINIIKNNFAKSNSPTLTGTPTAPTAAAGTNTTQIATTAFVQSAVSGLVDSAPQTLDTLNELAAALGDDPNFATTIATQIGGKADATHSHDAATTSAAGFMSAEDKTKLNGIAVGANAYTHPDTVTAGTVGTSTDTSGSTVSIPYVTYNANGHITATGTHTHTVTGFLTSDSTLNAAKLSGTIPAACYTDTTYSVATTSSDGLMSASDKTALNGISTTYVAQTSVGNAANKIPVYSAEGHLVLPNGIEIY